MIVGDLMTRTVITVSPETPVLDARQEMLKQRIRHLPVIGPGRKLLGIVTDRDIRLSLPSQATSLSVWELNYLLTKLTVDQVMTKTVITVGPMRPAPDAARLMHDQKIGALPVMDGERLVGIVTETDMLRAFVEMVAPELARRP